jgi:septal ring factor EnvC (AmiA/AmiB activator)
MSSINWDTEDPETTEFNTQMAEKDEEIENLRRRKDDEIENLRRRKNEYQKRAYALEETLATTESALSGLRTLLQDKCGEIAWLEEHKALRDKRVEELQDDCKKLKEKFENELEQHKHTASLFQDLSPENAELKAKFERLCKSYSIEIGHAADMEMNLEKAEMEAELKRKIYKGEHVILQRKLDDALSDHQNAETEWEAERKLLHDENSALANLASEAALGRERERMRNRELLREIEEKEDALDFYRNRSSVVLIPNHRVSKGDFVAVRGEGDGEDNIWLASVDKVVGKSDNNKGIKLACYYVFDEATARFVVDRTSDPGVKTVNVFRVLKNPPGCREQWEDSWQPELQRLLNE